MIRNKFVRKEIIKMKVELKELGFTYEDVAGWLGCSQPNVSKHMSNGTFSMEQYFIIKDHIERRSRW